MKISKLFFTLISIAALNRPNAIFGMQYFFSKNAAQEFREKAYKHSVYKELAIEWKSHDPSGNGDQDKLVDYLYEKTEDITTLTAFFNLHTDRSLDSLSLATLAIKASLKGDKMLDKITAKDVFSKDSTIPDGKADSIINIYEKFVSKAVTSSWVLNPSHHLGDTSNLPPLAAISRITTDIAFSNKNQDLYSKLRGLYIDYGDSAGLAYLLEKTLDTKSDNPFYKNTVVDDISKLTATEKDCLDAIQEFCKKNIKNYRNFKTPPIFTGIINKIIPKSLGDYIQKLPLIGYTKFALEQENFLLFVNLEGTDFFNNSFEKPLPNQIINSPESLKQHKGAYLYALDPDQPLSTQSLTNNKKEIILPIEQNNNNKEEVMPQQPPSYFTQSFIRDVSLDLTIPQMIEHARNANKDYGRLYISKLQQYFKENHLKTDPEIVKNLHAIVLSGLGATTISHGDKDLEDQFHKLVEKAKKPSVPYDNNFKKTFDLLAKCNNAYTPKKYVPAPNGNGMFNLKPEEVKKTTSAPQKPQEIIFDSNKPNPSENTQPASTTIIEKKIIPIIEWAEKTDGMRLIEQINNALSSETPIKDLLGINDITRDNLPTLKDKKSIELLQKVIQTSLDAKKYVKKPHEDTIVDHLPVIIYKLCYQANKVFEKQSRVTSIQPLSIDAAQFVMRTFIPDVNLSNWDPDSREITFQALGLSTISDLIKIERPVDQFLAKGLTPAIHGKSNITAHKDFINFAEDFYNKNRLSFFATHKKSVALGAVALSGLAWFTFKYKSNLFEPITTRIARIISHGTRSIAEHPVYQNLGLNRFYKSNN